MMSIIVLTGMLIYEGYRLWLWGNLAPTIPILPSPVLDLDRINVKTDYISAAMAASSATTFDNDEYLKVNGFTLAPDIDYRTTTPYELPTFQFVTNTNNLFRQAKDGKTTANGPEIDSYSSSNPLLTKSEIESFSDQSDNRNSSKLSDLLLLLRLHQNTTHKVNIYIKKKNKDTYGKPTAFDIIFNALNSRPKSLTSDLSHVPMNSLKPTYGEIPKPYSTVINAEMTTPTDQLKQILASTFTIPQNTRYQRNAENFKTTTALTPNTANADELQTMQILNDSYKYTGDARKSERGHDLNNLIPYKNSQLKVHEIEARVTNDKIETKSKENTYRPPTPLPYNKNTKSHQEPKTTLTQLFKKVKRNCIWNTRHALNKIVRRKMRHGRLYYTKSYHTNEQKLLDLQIVNTTIESITPSNIVDESTSNSLKTALDIDDDEDEFSEETEVNTQFETESTKSSVKTLDIKYELNTPIDNEDDDSESVEEAEETPTKYNKNKTDANSKRKRIEIPTNVDDTTTNNDKEDETESGEASEVSPVTQDDNNTLIRNKNKRKILQTTKSFFLKKHLDAEVVYDNIRYEKYHRKTRTSKAYDVINSTKNDVKETNYLEDEPDSAETTSISTTIGDDPEETPAAGMDILFILKTRLAKPTAATTSFESKDLLQILLPLTTKYRLDNDISYLDSYISNY